MRIPPMVQGLLKGKESHSCPPSQSVTTDPGTNDRQTCMGKRFPHMRVCIFMNYTHKNTSALVGDTLFKNKTCVRPARLSGELRPMC